ncbi:MAG: hypothetical protein ACRDGF_09845, partial [Chloroflexota bacterium]
SSTPDVGPALERQRAMQRSSTRVAGGAPAVEFISFGRSSMNPFIDTLSPLRRPALGIPLAAALVLAVSLFVSPVRGLAAQFLTIFRVQDLAPVTVDLSGQGIPNLSQLGDMTGQSTSVPAYSHVAGVAAASQAVGFTVAAPTALPSGLGPQPSVIVVTQGQTAGFTFRAAKAKAYLASIGQSNFALPSKFDGATLQLRIEPASVMAYLPAGTKLPAIPDASANQTSSLPFQHHASGRAITSQAVRAAVAPTAAADKISNTEQALLNGGLAVVETKSPSVDASGVSADDLRNFLLSMPGLPASTVAQLRSIGDWQHTLPIPVAPGASLRKVTVAGSPAIVGTNLGMHMVVWVRNGIVYAAASASTSDAQLLSLAASVQ